ncbi:hypothetical protein [Priestia aryabhattai]|uniref:hypothetical protein n=1 Tax=Priestia aryabhattai TaxID=412384 RepID=UPI002452E7FD|nr:hypothetical protein [Priestia aryabhattai]MDH3111366.1 hypothetical protein [Priestia aryabhattai]MDH3111376.1 hypothetical protein [Priestia aryabhattai]MDH3130068.1 hypothetical protein [Priestia aryabhattai]MDH3130078.1 hypothetical protein [Priestia aryabhattai]
MKYFEQAKEIWTKYVPKNGQSDIVEGELIRAIEKLRWEAQSNGNGNWDEGFEVLASYILEILNDNEVFNPESLLEIKSDVNTLLTSEYEPYLEDDLYDRLADRVIGWHLAKNGPIKRTINPNLYR